jgi:short-subunit dehydrogenase
VVITGASNGIGEALAKRYAQAGGKLGLVGRNSERLERVAEQCRALGSAVSLGQIDVRDRTAMTAWLEEFDDCSPIDLVIAKAGVLIGTPSGEPVERADAAYALMQTNVLGVLNTVQPPLRRMLTRGRGQVGIMSSVSAFAPLRDASAYSASKAAVLSYGLALRDRVRAAGVRVSVLCPGYITTEMTGRMHGWRPFEMSVDACADRLVRGLARNRGIVTFPWPLVIAARIGGLLPDGLRRLAMRPFQFNVSDAADRSV